MIDFNELIDNFLKREVRPRTSGKYYPSDSGNCIRKVWYSYKIPREADPEILKYFEAGNLIHDLVSKVIKSEKNPHIDLLATESPIFLTHEDFVISGRMDDVLLVRIDGKIYILEVKSVSNINYSKEAKKPHIAQLQLYMHSSGIRDGIICYIERNSLKSVSFTIPYDPEIIKESLERFGKLNSHLKSDKIPEPEGRINRKEFGWQCEKCQYREECYTANPATKELQ